VKKQESATVQKSRISSPDKQDAYSVLRRDIVELCLKPGTIVSIRDLCGHYAMSRSPMRDALIRLSQEGLIDLLPQRGIRISQIDLKRVEEERFLRVSVENNVMRAYMTHKQPGDAELLEESVKKQRESLLAKDFRRSIALDDEFHRFFYKATGNRFCADVIWRASGHYSRIRLLTCAERDIAEEVTRQHAGMIAAIRASDEEKLLTLFRNHLSKIDTDEHVLTKKYPDLFVQRDTSGKDEDVLRRDFLDTLKI
jgi:DNA-binding GntR family transcriptional regulator